MLHLLPELQEMEKSIMTFLTFACTFVMQAQCNCFIVLLAISVQILELWNLEVFYAVGVESTRIFHSKDLFFS